PLRKADPSKACYIFREFLLLSNCVWSYTESFCTKSRQFRISKKVSSARRHKKRLTRWQAFAINVCHSVYFIDDLDLVFPILHQRERNVERCGCGFENQHDTKVFDTGGFASENVFHRLIV